MESTKKVLGSFSWLCLSLFLLENSLVSANVDGQICTDVSFWKPIEYNVSNINCCSSRVELRCEETSQQVCVPVEEMECKIIGWSDCEMYSCPVEVSRPKIINDDFTEMSCKMIPHDIHHIKIIPECKNVTKKICTTIWDRDANGNPVWKGEEDCKDVTWLECHDTEVPAVIPSMKSECASGKTTTYQTCTNDTTIESHMCQRCTPKAASSCTVVKRDDCIQVRIKSCKPETVEDCSETPYNIPTQEFVHQDKCLFDQFGNAHGGDDPNAGEHGPDHHHEGHAPQAKQLKEARNGRHLAPRRDLFSARPLPLGNINPRAVE